MGPDSVFVPYVDPGVILAKAIRDGIATYRAEWNLVPKVIYMQNHGVIALGGSTQEALNITAMAILRHNQPTDAQPTKRECVT